MLVNDIILKVGKKEIANSSEVINEISKNGINKSISISLKRGNKVIKTKVKPTDLNDLTN